MQGSVQGIATHVRRVYVHALTHLDRDGHDGVMQPEGLPRVGELQDVARRDGRVRRLDRRIELQARQQDDVSCA